MKYIEKQLLKIYDCLLSEYGHRNWWPSSSDEETIIGAVLAPNVSWSNVKKALDNLRQHNLLVLKKIYETDISIIAPLIKSTRYYNQKAVSLKNTSELFVLRWNGDIENAKTENPVELRNILLKVKGIGEETADSILLYALKKPIFVVDAYTKRIFQRLSFINEKQKYCEVQKFFMDNLPDDLELFNDYHAQIVHLGNNFCNPKPGCASCILRKKAICKFQSN